MHSDDINPGHHRADLRPVMKQAKHTKDVVSETAQAAPAELPDMAYVDALLAETGDAQPETERVETEQTETGQTETICLPAQCLLRDAVEYRQHLLECVASDATNIDVGAVERIDTAFMQVLLSFVRSRNQPVKWLNMNSTFAEAASVLGLQAVLSLPAESVAA